MTPAARQLRQHLVREDGQALVFVAVALVALFGFLALVVDGSRAFVNHKQMQTAADAAALAGAYDIAHGLSSQLGADASAYSQKNGGPALHECAGSTDTNCWSNPYDGNAYQVGVRIKSTQSSLFGGVVGINSLSVSTSAVAALSAGGDTPPYSFVALASDGENHTLLVNNGTALDVANSLYTDSCGGMPGCQGGGNAHDSFDVFGTGGSITDEKNIMVVGGWETHNNDVVGANGGTCTVNGTAVTSVSAPSGTPSGGNCPTIAQPYLPDPFAVVPQPVPNSANTQCAASQTSAQAYNPAVTLNTGAPGLTPTATSVPITWPSGGGYNADPVSVGDVIEVDSEQMLVTAATGSGGTATLTVTRGYNGTTATTHADKTAVSQMVTLGSAGVPTPCTSLTLTPGTYYGGICLGGTNGDCTATDCAVGATAPAAYNPNITLNASLNNTDTSSTFSIGGVGGGNSPPAQVGDLIEINDGTTEQMLVTGVSGTGSASTLTVTRGYNGTTEVAHNKGQAILKVPASGGTATMAPGAYIIAGGGFHVCGDVSLDAPNVLIYNTNDPSAPTATYGTVGQVELNTTGTVTLGPQTLAQDPLYAGFTIFQDRSQVVDPPTFSPTAYNPAQSLTSSISATAQAFTVTGTTPTIYAGNVISIDSELMMVDGVTWNGGSSDVTVTRGYDGTTPATHSGGTAVNSVTYGGDTCNTKAKNAESGNHADMDIAFLAAGNPPGGYPLDNISGTIYAAGPRADFEGDLVGTANLAVLTSCIFINTGSVPAGTPTSFFDFQPNGGGSLAGVGESLIQ